MSHATVVSRGYETATQLSSTFSRGVLELKTLVLDPSGEEPSSVQRESIAELLEILQSLEYELSISAFAYGLEATAVALPEGLSLWLRATGRGQTVSSATIAAIRDRMQAQPLQTTREDIRILEHVERVIDAHAHHLFTVMTRELRGQR